MPVRLHATVMIAHLLVISVGFGVALAVRQLQRLDWLCASVQHDACQLSLVDAFELDG